MILRSGPFSSANYNIVVTSESDANCTQTFSGTTPCVVQPECNLDVTSNVVCLDETQFEIELTIAGDGTYDIKSGTTTLVSGQAAGTISLDPMNNGSYNIVVVKVGDNSCSQKHNRI